MGLIPLNVPIYQFPSKAPVLQCPKLDETCCPDLFTQEKSRFACNWTTMPARLEPQYFGDTWWHVTHEFFRGQKKPLIPNFVVSGNCILGKLTKILGAKAKAHQSLSVDVLVSYKSRKFAGSEIEFWTGVVSKTYLDTSKSKSGCLVCFGYPVFSYHLSVSFDLALLHVLIVPLACLSLAIATPPPPSTPSPPPSSTPPPSPTMPSKCSQLEDLSVRLPGFSTDEDLPHKILKNE